MIHDCDANRHRFWAYIVISAVKKRIIHTNPWQGRKGTNCIPGQILHTPIHHFYFVPLTPRRGNEWKPHRKRMGHYIINKQIPFWLNILKSYSSPHISPNNFSLLIRLIIARCQILILTVIPLKCYFQPISGKRGSQPIED